MKIDIGKEGELIKDAAGKLKLTYHYKDFTKEDLLMWLRVKIQRGFISMGEMSVFLEKIVEELLKKYNLSKLSVYRYQIKGAIENKIDDMVNDFTKIRFKEIESENSLFSSGEKFIFDDIINLIDVCPDSFSKHLYDKANKMNKEELDIAYQLNSLINIKWWFRNPEKTGFYIQGWLKNKFYPDFIVKTKKDNYFVLEYKGAQFEDSKDTVYKEEIGKKWAELADKKYAFFLFGKNDISKIVDEIVNN